MRGRDLHHEERVAGDLDLLRRVAVEERVLRGSWYPTTYPGGHAGAVEREGHLVETAVGAAPRRRSAKPGAVGPTDVSTVVEPVKPGHVLTGAVGTGGAVTGARWSGGRRRRRLVGPTTRARGEREHGDGEHQAPSSHEPGG